MRFRVAKNLLPGIDVKVKAIQLQMTRTTRTETNPKEKSEPEMKNRISFGNPLNRSLTL